jgi:hypothetical protein
MCFSGQEVDKDFIKAYMWLCLAENKLRISIPEKNKLEEILSLRGKISFLSP